MHYLWRSVLHHSGDYFSGPFVWLCCFYYGAFHVESCNVFYSCLALWTHRLETREFVYVLLVLLFVYYARINWAPSSEFVSSSIPSWQILTAHAQPFRGARDLAFCLKVPLDSLLVWASSEGSGETARMRRLAWTIAARIGDMSFFLCRDHGTPWTFLYTCLHLIITTRELTQYIGVAYMRIFC